MASPEDKAYEIMRELDVSYVLVIFGGLTGYSSDGEIRTLLLLRGSLQGRQSLGVEGRDPQILG